MYIVQSSAVLDNSKVAIDSHASVQDELGMYIFK